MIKSNYHVFYRINKGIVEVKVFEDFNEATGFYNKSAFPSNIEEPPWKRARGIEVEANFVDKIGTLFGSYDATYDRSVE